VISLASALVTFGTLLVAGVLHGRDTKVLRQQMVAQRVWPAGWLHVLSVALPVTELTVGGFGLTALVSGRGVTAAALLSVTLYLAFTLFGVFAVRMRPGVPCGCSADARPIDWSIVVRAAVLGCCAIVTSVLAPAAGEASALTLLFAGMAGLASGVVIWMLPEALADPLQRHVPLSSMTGA